MKIEPTIDPKKFVSAIANSGYSINDPIEIGHPTLWIPAPELQTLLDDGLRGTSLLGLPIKTRSKVVKRLICQVLGYPIPTTFKKSQPRFQGQMFDVYIQKSNNLQVWNEELSASRRYVLVRVSDSDVITRVKVVTGDTLGLLDTTGKLTRKYQATCIPSSRESELITPTDTSVLARFVTDSVDLRHIATPVNHPMAGELLTIDAVFKQLSTLVGKSFANVGADQERNRGAGLHRLVCGALGYGSYQDDGQFPDIRHQLVEVKLQTARTIDLGLVEPNSVDPLDVPMIEGTQIRHCDVRYAVFYAESTTSNVQITHLFLTTGEAFFTRFPQFKGKVQNTKQQIRLPRDFFDT